MGGWVGGWEGRGGREGENELLWVAGGWVGGEREVGGWVGGWVGDVTVEGCFSFQPQDAFPGVGGWVGGWVGGKRGRRRRRRDAFHSESEVEACWDGWVGWVGGWVGGGGQVGVIELLLGMGGCGWVGGCG